MRKGDNVHEAIIHTLFMVNGAIIDVNMKVQ